MKQLLALTVVLMVANPASAAVIDFTSDEAAVLDGQSSASVELDGVGLTVSAAPTPYAEIDQSSAGLGVDYFFDGSDAAAQIEGAEILTVAFDEPEMVTGFTVSNLYDWGIIQIEVGSYVIDGNDYGEFVAENSDGTLTVDLGSVEASSISFSATGDWSWFGDNGFTLASITTEPDSVTAVPELDPGALPGAIAILVGSAVVVRGRRRVEA